MKQNSLYPLRWIRYGLLCACLLVCSVLPCRGEEPIFHFTGIHYLASYNGCNGQALKAIDQLMKAMLEAAEASGAHILEESHFVFEPDGLTMVILLSESHASIHTYPEYNSCFVDLFTCGTSCSYKNFEQILSNYLKPENVNCTVLNR